LRSVEATTEDFAYGKNTTKMSKQIVKIKHLIFWQQAKQPQQQKHGP